jgi:hypothetical protein
MFQVSCSVLKHPLPPDARLGDDGILQLHQLRLDIRALESTFKQALVPLYHMDFDTSAKMTSEIDRLSRALLLDCSRVLTTLHEQQALAPLLNWRSPEQTCALVGFAVAVYLLMAAARRNEGDPFGFRRKWS